jgi:DNA polymerase-1
MSGEFHTISQADADLWFYTQTLTGDVTDGYSGCPSVGAKTAEKLLARSATWNTVVQAYQKQKLNADYALTQARLARILRFEDWDVDKGAIKLWEPS